MWDLPCDDDGTDEPYFCTQYQCFRYKTDHPLHLELALSAELAEMTCLYCGRTYRSYYQYLEDEKTTVCCFSCCDTSDFYVYALEPFSPS